MVNDLIECKIISLQKEKNRESTSSIASSIDFSFEETNAFWCFFLLFVC